MRTLTLGSWAGVLVGVALAAATVQAADPADPLPSWNEGASKKALLDFVKAVTTKDAKTFVAPTDRVATFDNDGTLWCEQPMYVQVIFMLDRVRQLSAKHPEWKNEQPFKAILEEDYAAMLAFGEKELLHLFAVTSTGMPQEEFDQVCADWLKTAKHPKRKVLYTQLAYQPQLELIKYLHQNQFKVFIVTGGGIEFVRGFSEGTYGIPKENVVGTTVQADYKLVNDKGVLIRKPELVPPLDDGPGKPVNLQRHIGRRPIFAFGNSDGDYEMLEFTTTGPGTRLGLILHHDDAEREYAYDRKSKIGHLERALDEAPKRGWVVVSMKKDFKVVFPE